VALPAHPPRIWDFDIPCAPILIDINVNGRAIKALAQPTKQSFLYVFDRVTGQPVWPIEERPVAKGDVPASGISPTQPFPTSRLRTIDKAFPRTTSSTSRPRSKPKR